MQDEDKNTGCQDFPFLCNLVMVLLNLFGQQLCVL